MSILGHGIDLIECERIARVLERHGDRFLERVLTPAERDRANRYKDRIPFIAGRWAAKEAILKMIGTGWRGAPARCLPLLPRTAGPPNQREGKDPLSRGGKRFSLPKHSLFEALSWQHPEP